MVKKTTRRKLKRGGAIKLLISSTCRLVNGKNRCYMNVILQALHAMPETRTLFESLTYDEIDKLTVDSCKSEIDDQDKKKCIKALKVVFDLMRTEKGKQINTSDIYLPGTNESVYDTLLKSNTDFRDAQMGGADLFYDSLINILVCFRTNTSIDTFLKSIELTTYKQITCADTTTIEDGNLVQYVFKLPIPSKDTSIQELINEYSVTNTPAKDPQYNQNKGCVDSSGIFISSKDRIKIPDTSRSFLCSTDIELKGGARIDPLIDITVDTKKFRIAGVVLHVANGTHYTYQTYDGNGNPSTIIDDTALYPSTTSNKGDIPQFGELFVYRRIDTLAALPAAPAAPAIPPQYKELWEKCIRPFGSKEPSDPVINGYVVQYMSYMGELYSDESATFITGKARLFDVAEGIRELYARVIITLCSLPPDTLKSMATKTVLDSNPNYTSPEIQALLVPLMHTMARWEWTTNYSISIEPFLTTLDMNEPLPKHLQGMTDFSMYPETLLKPGYEKFYP